ncbi:hypothetical protein CE143_12305 [Photorhabdus luminescens]|uniref:Pvc16 N-terminal domain-containing protein n=1 Tax=Photorhabdus akhurstii TaxID=171438 RepID=A0ABX8LTH9_9GAMM|nr:DUF4255 domain-containing protein [Photorhabdus akhurstii]MBS9427307.1 DUF4255 domain-containing protein [Photorhabdus akhurstii]QXF33837.1 hypothetical protein B0X70_12305 [Photorhabdus akhurstii]UJD75652.1 hypothetical protein CE143_12305 [Photorhabdus luminescens]
MTNIIDPNNAIVAVNTALHEILSQHLNTSNQIIDIRFDLPEINSTPAKPTVSVFLYDIHEDLQLRSAEPRSYNPATNSLLSGWVNINYNYLITYWHSNQPSGDASNPDSHPNNQAARVMTAILNALVNNRQLPKIPAAYTRVIPPQENLNSLGNFWQALGNRPRLSLLYSITAPVKLQDIKDVIKPVSQISASMEQKPNLDNSQINQALFRKLCADLGGTEDVHLALSKVNLTTKPAKENNENQNNQNVILEVSGITRLDYLPRIKGILSTWKNSHSAVVRINNIGIITSEDKSDKLIAIKNL